MIVNSHELWAPPTVPHAYDDEFDGAIAPGAVGSSWSLWNGAFAATAIDPYASIGAGATRADFNSMRRSHYALQLGVDGSYPGGFRGIHKPVTVPAQCTAWARVFAHAALGVTATYRTVGIILAQSSGGAPDTANMILAYAFLQNGYWKARAGMLKATVFTGGGDSADFAGRPPEWDLVLIHRDGNTYSVWAGSLDGSWVCLAMFDGTGLALDRLALVAYSSIDHAPGSFICGWDFIRWKDSIYLP